MLMSGVGPMVELDGHGAKPVIVSGDPGEEGCESIRSGPNLAVIHNRMWRMSHGRRTAKTV
jgi:hypothetical protein